MRIYPSLGAAAALVLGLLMACGPAVSLPANAEGAVAPDTVLLQVEHTALSAPSVTVHLLDPVGTSRLLGVVAPGQTETFALAATLAAGDYRLVARTPDGRSQTSRPFILLQREGIRWDLFTNAVTPLPEEEAEPQ